MAGKILDNGTLVTLGVVAAVAAAGAAARRGSRSVSGPHVAALKAACDAKSAALRAVADAMRNAVIRPLCDKWGVTFGAGMGSWSFYAPTNAERGPHAPIDPKSYRPDVTDTAEDRLYFGYGLPDAFWAELAAAHAKLDAAEDAADEPSGFVAGYFNDYPDRTPATKTGSRSAPTS